MISDTLFEGVCQIEKYEKDNPECYAGMAEEIRKVKLEMAILQTRLDMAPQIAEQFTAADFDWLRAEALKRGAKKPPYEFQIVYGACIRALWRKWRKSHRLTTATTSGDTPEE